MMKYESIKVINQKTKEVIKEFPITDVDENGDLLCRQQIQDAIDFASETGGNVFFSASDKQYNPND